MSVSYTGFEGSETSRTGGHQRHGAPALGMEDEVITNPHSFFEHGKRGSPGPLMAGRATSSICQAHAKAHAKRSAIISWTVILPSSKIVKMLARREGKTGLERRHEFQKGTSRHVWKPNLLSPGARQVTREEEAGVGARAPGQCTCFD